jgi:hypothetical protein
MSYIPCPKCGQNALSIATRCPRCGHPFDSRLWQAAASDPRRRPIPVGLVIAGVLVVLLVLSVVQQKPWRAPGTAPPPRPPTPMDSAPPPLPSPPVAAAPAESVPARDSAPPVESPLLAADSVTAAAAPAPAPAPPASAQTELRYATTWVNVRADRSGTAPVLRILKPGGAVTVDSLRHGWYRVVEDGQTLGYVDRSLVGPTPESSPD